MSTQLFLIDSSSAAADKFSTGNNDAPIGTAKWGATTGWDVSPLSTSRGVGVTTGGVGTIASNTTGLELTTIVANTLPGSWVSAPLDQDVTIAGTITFNFWMGENTTSVNAGAMCVVERITSLGAIAETVASSAKGVELPKISSIAAQNWTVDATDTAFLKGDRIRIRVLAKNVGTMGADATGVQMTYSGATAAASGDSYVQFTETFGFLRTDPAAATESTTLGTSGPFGRIGDEKAAQSFQVPSTGTLSMVQVAAGNNTGTPTDGVQASIQADSAGSPSGTPLVGPVTGGWSSGQFCDFALSGITLSSGTTYWIVVERTGSLNSSHYRAVSGSSTDVYANGSSKGGDTGSWAAGPGAILDLGFRVYMGPVKIFPTEAASDIDPGGGSVTTDEAWTSRGGGVQTAVVNSVTGWTAPVQWTTTAGGNTIEWFTRPLAAFTLAAPVLVHLRAKASSTINAVVAAELAITESDGTSPVTWARLSYPDFLGTSEAADDFYLTGDDTAVTDGQRLRLRVQTDDSVAGAQTSGQTLTFYYAGAAPGSSGDSWLLFSQTLVESAVAAVSVVPKSVPDHLPFIPRGRSM